jgi:hypothetical protein
MAKKKQSIEDILEDKINDIQDQNEEEDFDSEDEDEDEDE